MMTVGQLKQIIEEFNYSDDTEIKIAIFNSMTEQFDVYESSLASHRGNLVLYDDWHHSTKEDCYKRVKVLDK